MSSTDPIAPSDDLHCPNCAYNLHSLTSNRCPECGQPFDPASLAALRLPWMLRHQIGRTRAFYRTFVQLIRRPSSLGKELALPPDLQAARQFQRIVAILVCTTLVLSFTLACIFAQFGSSYSDDSPLAQLMSHRNSGELANAMYENLSLSPFLSVLESPLSLILIPMSCIIFLWMLNGTVRVLVWSATDKSIPRERSLALGRYLCGPWLILLPFAAAFICLLALNDDPAIGMPFWLFSTICAVTFVPTYVFIPLCCFDTWRSFRAITHCGSFQAAVLLPICPIITVFFTTLAMAILAYFTGFLAIVYYSMR